MPSSMIFAGLVVIWLLILVPAVARHRQEVARPSVAALSGRVLERPRRPEPEVYEMDETDVERGVATRTATEIDPQIPAARAASDDAAGDERDEHVDRRVWERPSPRYRPGRGGFDPEAAALAARARSTFRQRVVLGLLLAALVTGVVAAAAVHALWWAHLVVDVLLVGYLANLRRQVRTEEAIRDRRAARMAGTRRPAAADDPDLDPWARRGREATHAAEADPELVDPAAAEPTAGAAADPDDLLREEPERVAGTGAPLPRVVTSLDELTVESALPRLQPASPPPLPAGTMLVEDEDDDPEQHDLDEAVRPEYRRAANE